MLTGSQLQVENVIVEHFCSRVRGHILDFLTRGMDNHGLQRANFGTDVDINGHCRA